MKEPITSKQYSEKIVEVAYHNFPLVYPKETVIKCVNALVDEYTKQYKSRIIELEHFIVDGFKNSEFFDKEFEDKYYKIIENIKYCQDCDGTGRVYVNPSYTEGDFKEKDCDECNGIGII